jgi:hypothetical protein
MKISENPAYMFGQNFKKMFGFRQALAYNDTDWPTGLKKAQICLDGDIRPQQWSNTFRLANQASKTAHFAQNNFKITDLMMPKCIYCMYDSLESMMLINRNSEARVKNT